MQRELNSLGYKGKDGKILDVDGKYGTNTYYAVKQYQISHDLDADGVAGSETWGNIFGFVGGKLNPFDFENMTTEDIISSIPSSWTVYSNNGFVHVKDASGVIRLRLDPPDDVTPSYHVHIYDSKGNALDKNLDIASRKSPYAHLKYKGPSNRNDDSDDNSGGTKDPNLEMPLIEMPEIEIPIIEPELVIP